MFRVVWHGGHAADTNREAGAMPSYDTVHDEDYAAEAAVQVRLSPIRDLLGNTNEHMAKLGAVIGELRDRLDPVLQPAETKPKDNPARLVELRPRSQVSLGMEGLSAQVGACTSQLMDLIERLDV